MGGKVGNLSVSPYKIFLEVVTGHGEHAWPTDEVETAKKPKMVIYHVPLSNDGRKL